uniref:Coagulation factor XI-like n=1 Tax=Fundulus heteroclitus TaxID=8078 RepID=A0A3Q2U5Q0_FUNHE
AIDWLLSVTLCSAWFVFRIPSLLDWDFPGSDVRVIFSPDAEHCQQLCTQESSCLFWAFIGPDSKNDNRHFHCFLKATSSGEPSRQVPKQGTTAGYSLKSCNPDSTGLYEDVDFPGADYRSLFTADQYECQRACTDNPGCQFFSFFSGAFNQLNVRYKCNLKFSWTVPRTPIVRALSDRISGFSQRMKPESSLTECKGTLFPNVNLPGHDIEVLAAASPEQCQVLCSDHPLCTYFTYVSNGFRCYLKNNEAEMVPRTENGATSGLPARSCQLDNGTYPITLVYEGIDFPYSDIRFFPLDNFKSCEKSCTEDPNCQFYSYVTTSHFCYLKRVITMHAPPKVTEQANTVSGFTLRNCPDKSAV